MKSHILKKLTSSIIIAALLVSCGTPSERDLPEPEQLKVETQQQTLELVYDEPARGWETEALPMGNGFIGAMLYGGVNSDRIQINEHTYLMTAYIAEDTAVFFAFKKPLRTTGTA